MEVINPRRACARVTVLVLSVCVFPILAPRAIRRTNSSISDFSVISMKYKKGFFFKTLRSEVTASFTHL